MRRTILSSFLYFLLFISGIQAGNKDSVSAPKRMELPSIGAGFGMMSYYGTVGNTTKAQVGTFAAICPAFHFTAEERLNDLLAISVNGVFGHVAGNNHQPSDNQNFKTKVNQYGVDAVFPFDNGIIMKRGAMVAPYISLGIAMMMYRPYADLLDSQGKPYYYWSDGSIRNVPQGTPSSQIVSRDYVYSAPLSGPKTTLVIPLGFGFRFNMTEHLSSRINFAYNYTLVKDIDGSSDATTNDKYVYLNVSVHYRFGKDPVEVDKDANYEKVDWTAIDNLDSDEDGVKDVDDKCPGTPWDVKVDVHGCPLDADGDGVPDYLDKEPNTKKGAKVDVNGVALNYKQIAANQKVIARYDSIYLARSNSFNAAPSMDKLNEVEKSIGSQPNTNHVHKPLPDEFKDLDKNEDGFISAKEVASAIDGFFSGENSLTVDKINRLIDFFFEQ